MQGHPSLLPDYNVCDQVYLVMIQELYEAITASLINWNYFR